MNGVTKLSGAINIDPKEFTQTIFKAFSGNGIIDSSGIDFISKRGDKKLIIVAAAPRTGSTYLTNVLVKSTGFPFARLCSAYSTNEHDLYLPALYFMNKVGCVSQLHMKGTYHNAALMRTFGITPIILVRNIFDIVASLLGELRLNEKQSAFGTGVNGFSFIWQDEDIKNCSDERLLDVIVDLAIPWYVNFYVSWFRLCEQGAVNAKWVSYEDMMADKQRTVNDIIEFLGVNIVASNIDEILDYRGITFNIGSSGRGKQMLSATQKERIKHLFSYYPNVDFKYYGL